MSCSTRLRRRPRILLVFLPGTFGKPPGPTAFLHAAADAGYRVISLDYNDEPAWGVLPWESPRPVRAIFDGCASTGMAFQSIPVRQYQSRNDRQSIGQVTHLSRPPGPAAKLERLISRWRPNWSRIVLAGQSQGAGMAAYIAKEELVKRVILFSSPWDFVASNANARILAPWIATPAKTPPERWFGAAHRRENQASLLRNPLRALRIPPQNIRVYKGDLPRPKAGEDNPSMPGLDDSGL